MGKSRCNTSSRQDRDSLEREWRRQRKRMVEESAKVTASAADPTSALDFWRQVVRNNLNTEERWGHDGFEELEKLGPPVPQSIERNFHSLKAEDSPSPSLKRPRIPCPSIESEFSQRKRKGKVKGKKKFHKSRRDKKMKSKSRSRSRSSTSSSSSSLSESDIVWVEKKR